MRWARGGIERLGTVAASTREGAWEQVKHEPDAWAGSLDVGEELRLAIMPATAWPEFTRFYVSPRLAERAPDGPVE